MQNQVEQKLKEQYKIERELKEARDMLRNLSARIESLREEDKIRTSKKIHDELGQSLTVLQINLAELGNFMLKNHADLFGKIQLICNIVDGLIQNTQEMFKELNLMQQERERS